ATHDLRTAVHDRERVLVAIASERTSHLLVREEGGSIQFDDPAGHRPADPEVSGMPGDVLTQADQAVRHSGDRLFMVPGHRAEMRIDAHHQIEDPIERRSYAGRAFERDGHVSIALGSTLQARWPSSRPRRFR